MSESLKVCSTCRCAKRVEEFRKKRNQCKACYAAYKAAYRTAARKALTETYLRRRARINHETDLHVIKNRIQLKRASRFIALSNAVEQIKRIRL